MFEDNNFYDDAEKMRDFKEISKEEFLESYSYLTEAEYDNTRRMVVEELRNRVYHNHISDIKELGGECGKFKGAEIDPYEDVLHPMEYNTCDRCGDIEDSETGFFWIDGFEWENGNPEDEAILKGLEEEKVDFCAICYDCLNELKEKGKKVLTK